MVVNVLFENGEIMPELRETLYACDRCGDVADVSKGVDVSIHEVGSKYFSDHALCPRCANDLEKFMDGMILLKDEDGVFI